MMYEESGVRLLTCILKHCSSKMLTLDLWWACNELIDAIHHGSCWSDAEGEATSVCRDLLALSIWGRASFEMQKKMWSVILQGVMSENEDSSNFRDRVLKSYNNNNRSSSHHRGDSENRAISKSFRRLLRDSVFYLRDLLSELQPWGVYAHLDSKTASSKEDETIKHRSTEETLRLRESMINVVCYIIRETYLQKQDREKKRKNHISDLVRGVRAWCSSVVFECEAREFQ